MHNKDKYPEIWEVMQNCKAKLEPLMAERNKNKVKVKELRNQQIEASRKFKKEINAANDVAMKDIDEIRRLRKQISAFANAMDTPK